MERSEQLTVVAEGVGRSVFFLWRMYATLTELQLFDQADKLAEASVQLRDVEIQLAKLASGRALLPRQENLFDDAGERLPF